jgi:hypothetical protein
MICLQSQACERQKAAFVSKDWTRSYHASLAIVQDAFYALHAQAAVG